METALYLLPVTLGDTPLSNVLPQYNSEIIAGIRHFIVEDVRSARRFLRKVDPQFDIDGSTFYAPGWGRQHHSQRETPFVPSKRLPDWASLELSPSVESCGCGLGPSPVSLG